MEDDGLRVAFSPLALVKPEFKPSEPSTSTFKPTEVVPKESNTVIEPTPRRSCRKRKTKDRFDEPLEQFVARHKRAKKEKKAKKGGLQLMLTDFFETTKRAVKKEKCDCPKVSTAPKDFLQSNQYDFDRSAVPEDDDIEIVEVVPV